jgi:hypothetical protein
MIRQINWDGPYSWPGFESHNGLEPLPKSSGVYLQAFRHKNGYLIYAAGVTTRYFLDRFREHSRSYRNGEYNVLDADSAEAGVRLEHWHGWQYARKHRDEFELKKDDILSTVETQLSRFCMFTLSSDYEKRILERIEAAVMNCLYDQLPPVCDLPDRGMYLAPRRKDEEFILLKNYYSERLYGLPEYMEI